MEKNYFFVDTNNLKCYNANKLFWGVLIGTEDRIFTTSFDLKSMVNKYDNLKFHPVNSVIWVDSKNIVANEYNPNKVAPPEMELLELSIMNDGFTQPIVVWLRDDGIYEVVDGFHRHLVGKKIGMKKLPVVVVNNNRTDKNDRIASTIRHNRARGKHIVDAMSSIVLELKNRNWKNSRIAKELGMDEDEILRLCQISGLEDIFKDSDFSKSWNLEDSEEDDFVELTDEVTEFERDENRFRTTNTNDPDRIFHTYDKWECLKNGFYSSGKEGMSQGECELEYARFLSNLDEFEAALKRVICEWKFSCEQYLTNKAMNRIAYLGQASVCLAKGIPSKFRGGFHLLSEKQQSLVNKMALKYLNIWLKNNGRNEVSMEEALGGIDRQVEIY
jgi:hypothetical protein